MNNINQKIPEGWSVKKLGEVTTLLTNGFVGSATLHYTEDETGVIYIQGFNVNINSFDLTGIKKVTLEFHKKNKKSCLQEGDLLTIQTGDIGVTARVPKYLAGSNCHALIISRFDTAICNSKFYLQYYNSSICQSRFKKIETGSTMKHLNVGDLESEYIPVPPLPEQEKIAGILSCWDDGIEKLSALIEKKKIQKKALMQKLLTGKTRLSGFTQPWKEVKLGEITEFISGYSFDSSDFKENGVPLIRISNIKNDKISLDNDSVFLDLSFLQKYTNYCIKYGDLLLAMSGATTGKMGVNKSNIPMLLNQRVGIIRAKMSWQSFLNQYLMRFNNKILQMSYGGAQPNIGSNDIKRIKLYIPSDISEQQAIADVLSTADDEIDLLNKKLILFKEQKKGLMQQLLTGNIRVKVN